MNSWRQVNRAQSSTLVYSRAAQTFSILDALVESRFSQGALCQILTSTLKIDNNFFQGLDKNN
jgi:hypothetical protein